MLGDVLSFTTVRVDPQRAEEWERFYSDHAQAYVSEMPGCRSATLWRGDDGTFQAIFDHARLDALVRSRRHRASAEWQARVAAFRPWYPSLTEYATMHLQLISRHPNGSTTRALLTTSWTIEGPRVPSFEAAYRRDIEREFAATLPDLVGVSRYVALSAELHRHGGDDGALVISQKHHFEGRKDRLVYVTFFELAQLPGSQARSRALADLRERLRPHASALADRLEVFADLSRTYARAVPVEGTPISRLPAVV